MKRDNVNYLVAGTVVLLAFGALFAVLYKITGRSGATDPYHVHYQYVAGLRFGTPVYFEGYRIGQIEQVTPRRNGSKTDFRVDLELAEGWPIPTDSVAEITTAGLLSDVFIVLHQGDSDDVLSADSEIKGREASDVFAALNSLAGDISNLTEQQIKPLIATLSTRLESITGSVDEQTPLVFDDARALLERLNNAAGSLEQVLSSENVGHIDVMLANFSRMSAEANSLAEELRGTRAHLDDLLGEAKAMVAENRPGVAKLVRDISATMELLDGRLDSISYNLDQASRNLNEFARAVRKQPNRLLFAPQDDDVEAEQ